MDNRYLPDLVLEMSRDVRDRTAIVDVDGETSYAELALRVGQTVRQLSSAGVRHGDRVGLYIPRSAAYVTSLLAVTTLGAVAVPMDPDYPVERLDQMCAAAEPRVVLHTDSDLSAGIATVPWLRLDQSRSCSGEVTDAEKWRERDSARQPALILFTSGSTGRPKGVVLHHAGLVNRLEWGQRTYGFDTTDRVLHKASVSFDAAIHEIFAPLIAGGTLVIAPPGLQFDSRGLVRLIRETEVTTAHFVPSVLRHVLEEDDLRYCTSLRRVLCGGEALDMGMVRRLRDLLGCDLFNYYGPTETSVNATTWDSSEAFDGDIGPLGRPVDGVTCHVLDEAFEPLPPGSTGELWIGGVGVALGYLGDGALTAQRFVPNPWGPGRLYRTGDLARLAPQGYLEFRGRVDDQVKVRGVRVEPESVAGVLRAHPLVRDAVVVGLPDDEGGVRLVAYVAGRRRNSTVVDGLRRVSMPNGLPVATPSPDETQFLYRQVFEEDEYARYGIRIGPGDVVVDVGANVGLFSLWAHGQAPGVRVLAVEPNPDVLPYLRVNLELNEVDAQVESVAVTDRAGSATLTSFPGLTYLSGLGEDRDAQAAQLVRSHIAHTAAAGAQATDTANRWQEAEGRLRPTEHAVPTVDLSTLLDEHGLSRVDLLKINVEGAEAEVLRGVRKEHWERVRQVCLEVERSSVMGPPIVATLRDAGFTVHSQPDWAVGRDADVSYVYATRGPRSWPSPAGDGPRTHPALLTVREIHRHAAALLPPAMRPGHVVLVENLPRLPNGKVSRHDLPPVELPGPHDPGAAESGETRDVLREIWRGALGMDRINDDDDFVSLGGHSLLALRVTAQVRQATGIESSPSQCLRATSFLRWAGEVLCSEDAVRT
ncbi:amino acid adenylation domain-containing protein [Streptomyces albidoflavus]